MYFGDECVSERSGTQTRTGGQSERTGFCSAESHGCQNTRADATGRGAAVFGDRRHADGHQVRQNIPADFPHIPAGISGVQLQLGPHRPGRAVLAQTEPGQQIRSGEPGAGVSGARGSSGASKRPELRAAAVGELHTEHRVTSVC